MNKYFSEVKSKEPETREVRLNSVLKKEDLEGLNEMDISDIDDSKDSAEELEKKLKKEEEEQKKQIEAPKEKTSIEQNAPKGIFVIL
jgi:hypothetical protein